MDKTKPREHRIITIADAFTQIPPNRIDAFLRDLGAMMKYHKRITKAMGQLARSKMELNLDDGFVWIDDGKNDLRLTIESNQQCE